MIYHIYWGTAGNAGLYLDEIYQTLQTAGFQQEAFVNHYYPFDYGHKVFFKWTEMGHGKKLGALRNPIRYIELLYALTVIYIHIFRHKPEIVNYSLIGVFAPVLFFLKLIKKTTRCKLILTCHDVMPFENTVQSVTKQEQMRKEGFDLADYLLVHNQNSANELKKSFHIQPEKIRCHPFPIMDMRKIYHQQSAAQKKYDFLFMGHLRKEKGIQILLEAWQLFHHNHPDATLCIAGFAPFGFDKSKYSGLNINFILQFLSDEEYFELGNTAHCVILPYTKGTNSGVVSTLITLNGNIITSDLDMFRSNSLLSPELMFENGKPQSLQEKMELVYAHKSLSSNNERNIKDYRNIFHQEVKRLYSSLT
ncbi:MAG: glycosyltransferase family 4 protein [Prevotella sp.]|nr:glycosyltransferase family 4 protein [Prevotella sp.]